MPITAYSNAARRELDVEQWLGLNFYDVNADPNWVLMSGALREKAAVDIECSCCGARGATLVRGARSKGTGKSVAQPHFRFSSPDDSNPHNTAVEVRGAQDDNLEQHLEPLLSSNDIESCIRRQAKEIRKSSE
ncbi:hypothetical protein [Paraburkholderia sp. Ac-20347]|uniref:hypothetical protein n=1 Tax=Paraburkholderia sp. Ac-20347 TaxID=2703892 RepID=UPI001980E833|nr:hypothetical protein [Paraburkholderia sp. Ac-20347]MBN3814114.1 hypothetical protein [Paraburkholderia sp. Ac-20347]